MTRQSIFKHSEDLEEVWKKVGQILIYKNYITELRICISLVEHLFSMWHSEYENPINTETEMVISQVLLMKASLYIALVTYRKQDEQNDTSMGEQLQAQTGTQWPTGQLFGFYKIFMGKISRSIFPRNCLYMHHHFKFTWYQIVWFRGVKLVKNFLKVYLHNTKHNFVYAFLICLIYKPIVKNKEK